MSSALADPTSPAERVDAIRAAMPAAGLFAEKDWLLSPEPFPLAPKTVRQLQELGPRLQRFQQAANQIYYRSRKGKLPGWIADTLDRENRNRCFPSPTIPEFAKTCPGSSGRTWC